RVTPGAIRLHQGLAVAHQAFGFAREGGVCARALETVPRTDEGGIERQRLTKVGDGLLLLALGLIDIASVVVGKRVARTETDRCRKVLEGWVKFSLLRVGKTASVEGDDAARGEPYRLGEIGDRAIEVTLDQIGIATTNKGSGIVR